MSVLTTMVALFLSMIALGMLAWHLDNREREERLTREALETSQLLDAALEERLAEIDQYRHYLAATLQRLGLEQVRAAVERAGEDGF